MSLRDWFAGQVLLGSLPALMAAAKERIEANKDRGNWREITEPMEKLIVSYAWRVADAMIAERARART